MEKSLFSKELLSGKVAIITGGSNGGMLQEIAKEFLAHSAKAVVLIARKKDKLDAVVKELAPFAISGSECVGMSGDVRDEKGIQEIVSQVVEKFGRIDILVNGAAGNFLCPAESLSIKGFKTVMEIDAIGTFLMSKEVFKQAMKQQRSGVIINITTNLHYNGTAMVVHAGSAKASVDATMKHLAVEWGPYGVRVVGLSPGFIAGTEGMARLSDMSTVGDKEKSRTAREKGSSGSAEMSDLVPIGRLGQPKDIANTALYLASDIASYVSGTIVLVDGGANLTCPNFPIHNPEFVNMWQAPRRAKM